MKDQNFSTVNHWLNTHNIVYSAAELVHKFPYFATGRLMMAMESRDESSARLAALYFYNDRRLSYLLSAGLETETEVVQQETAGLETAGMADIGPSETVEGPIEMVASESGEEQLQKDPDENLTTTVPEIEPETTEAGENEAELLALEKENLSKLLEQQLKAYQSPVKKSDKLPVASPFFTIDFFASQGIKMPGTAADQLEGKVKKFTEWLVLLKNKNPNPTDLGTDPETEKIIDSIAQSSNHTQEVITETMAEVLVKQGKREKAIHLYEKLSFLNPSKSTYFAAKINELK